jgi:GH24 family phage-related lysozyme (muramidase)
MEQADLSQLGRVPAPPKPLLDIGVSSDGFETDRYDDKKNNDDLTSKIEAMAQEQNPLVPQAVLDLIREREGYENVSYLDSVGKLTGGVGHLLVGAEADQYPKGTVISDAIILQWEQSDTLSAYKAAQEQAELIGIDDPILINALTSVCYQLGNSWNENFPATWHCLSSHDWLGAATNAAKSHWFKETPVRVQDFQTALRALNNGASADVM